MLYDQALEEARKVGFSKCKGLPWLAVTCETLSHVHAINPRLVFEGAMRKALSATQVRKLDALGLADLMFI